MLALMRLRFPLPVKYDVGTARVEISQNETDRLIDVYGAPLVRLVVECVQSNARLRIPIDRLYEQILQETTRTGAGEGKLSMQDQGLQEGDNLHYRPDKYLGLSA